MNIPALRSPYDKVGGLIYFGRMLDKIRLHAKGALPADYVENLGQAFDKFCVQFLGVAYADLAGQVKMGASDEAALEWCFMHGRRTTDDEIFMWNEFIRKRGWNDSGSERLKQRKADSGFASRDEIRTLFDYIDADEERPIRQQP
jgi:gluconokinase